MRHYRYGQGQGKGMGGRGQYATQGRGRPLKEIKLEEKPKVEEIIPKPLLEEEVILLTLAEYEAMRLVDYEGCDQEESGQLMNVSRGTIWRLLASGREKVMEMMLTGKKIVIEKIP
ncbi:MAG: DUF134 domain-containing protein [Candidatus Thorarchaeota archaeon]